ncbi:MAG: hypothetical protein EB165_05625 [Euryarchaeota archaeon]|nr:hypothetical protein [Euryarchaeota archaeon]NDB94107.1 hypothetical protein [Euryarchaeota archaeon]
MAQQVFCGFRNSGFYRLFLGVFFDGPLEVLSTEQLFAHVSKAGDTFRFAVGLELTERDATIV